MKLTKIETNYKRKIFFKETENLQFRKDNSKHEKELINIYPDLEEQEIIGFGAALTESSAYSFSLLPKDKQSSFLDEYFGEKGIRLFSM